MPVSKRVLVLRSVWAFIWAVPTAFFSYAFYIRYWVYRGEFNDLGRYWDGVGVHTDSAFVWCLPAAGFALALTISFFRTWRLFRAMKQGGGNALHDK